MENETEDEKAREEKAEAQVLEDVIKLRRDVIKIQQLAKEASIAGDIQGAIRLYTSIIELLLDEEDTLSDRERKWLAKLLIKRATSYQRLGNYYLSTEDASLAISYHPGYLKAYLLKGFSLVELERFAEGSEAFKIGLEWHPHDQRLKYGFSLCLSGLRKVRHRYTSKFHQYPRMSTLTHKEVVEDTGAQYLLKSTGATLNIQDIYETEQKFIRKYIDPIQTLKHENEHMLIMNFVDQHKSDLFNLYASYLRLPHNDKNAADRDGVIRFAPREGDASRSRKVDLSSSTKSMKKRAGNRKSFCVKKLPSVESEYQPLGVWTRMSEDQFWDLLTDTQILTEKFGQAQFTTVWKRISSNFKSKESKTHQSEQKEEIPAHLFSGGYILFPKFIEGLLRLLLLRYQPSPNPELADGTPTTPPSISQRVEYAFNIHLLSGSLGMKSVELKRKSHLQAAQIFVTQAQHSVCGKYALHAIRDAFEAHLQTLFQYFTKQSNAKSMTMVEFVQMLQVLGMKEFFQKNNDLIFSTIVAVSQFIGDIDHDTINFEKFFDLLVWICEIKTRDGMVPFSNRMETFLINDILRPAEAKTDIGNLFS